MMIVVALVYIWAVQGSGISLKKIINGIPNLADFVRRLFPPDLSNVGTFLGAALETVQIALIGVTLATLFAFPLSFLAARNTTPNRIIYQMTRVFLDICRGIAEIIWALMFVTIVGLGPFPGVLALMVHELGCLGKYFSESIENVKITTTNAIKSTGANKIQIITHGIIPELKPLFINYIFYYFEHGVRAATVLGLVGAGGIGFQLLMKMKLFKYREMSTLLIILVAMVIMVDRASAYARKQILKDIKKI
jgi:phosphonate transport system permease protein